ncbi:MAG: GNAT family N-acetyltransferase [Methanomicrobiales archaeon]|jgi:nucleotide-binding universal stress UspA family protein/N-acetylglutamate synthase-like GNAT family acetyltransferase
MFPRVLLPTDFSPHAERTVHCIAEVPGIEDLILLHVLEPGPDRTTAYGQHTVETRIRESLLHLEGIKKWTERPDLPVRILVHERIHDDVAETILSVAAKEKADLIALGARGRTLKNLVLGSVSAAVLRDAKTGVLVVHDRALDAGEAFGKYCRSAFAKVLCPVDFSKPSLDTVGSLPGLMKGGGVLLLHVLGGDIHGWDFPIARGNAGKRLEEMKGELEKAGFQARTILAIGEPAAEVLRVAEEEDVSMILLTRFGKRDYVQAVGIGSTAAAIAGKAGCPVLVRYPHLHYEVVARELKPPEFFIADGIWLHYHQLKTDQKTDRIFVTFADGVPAGVARCRRHPDGLEVDGVFVLEEFRNRGYARRLLAALVPACGSEDLYMHSTVELEPFYRTFGFESIPEEELPPAIAERYSFAMGDLGMAQVQPMRRRAG